MISKLNSDISVELYIDYDPFKTIEELPNTYSEDFICENDTFFSTDAEYVAKVPEENSKEGIINLGAPSFNNKNFLVLIICAPKPEPEFVDLEPSSDEDRKDEMNRNVKYSEKLNILDRIVLSFTGYIRRQVQERMQNKKSSTTWI